MFVLLLVVRVRHDGVDFSQKYGGGGYKASKGFEIGKAWNRKGNSSTKGSQWAYIYLAGIRKRF